MPPTVNTPSSPTGRRPVGTSDATGPSPGPGRTVDADLARMRQCLQRLQALRGEDRLERDCAQFATLYELTTVVCEYADADGCRPATDVACSLCFVLDRMTQPDERTLKAIDGHIVLLERLFRDGCWGNIESGECELAGRLAELRAFAGVAGIAEPSHGIGGRQGGG